jgi:hypothetical protein
MSIRAKADHTQSTAPRRAHVVGDELGPMVLR